MSSFKIKPNSAQIELSLNTLYYLYNMRSLSELPDGFYSHIICDFFTNLDIGKLSSKSAIPSTLENINKLVACLNDTKFEIYEKILLSQGLDLSYDKEYIKIKIEKITSRNGFINKIYFRILYPCLLAKTSYHEKSETFIKKIINHIKTIQMGVSEKDIFCDEFDFYNIESIDLKHNSIYISRDFDFYVVDLFKALEQIKGFFGTENSKDYFYDIKINNNQKKSITLGFKKHIKLEV